MPRVNPSHETDPIGHAIANSHLMAGRNPVPLVATSYDISIHGGLAGVVATRTFRNFESQSIEATLTFPIPVDAVFYGLEARIGDRVVKAIAKAKTNAREDYEDALDRGKTAILHEELLKGIHLLSVGHIVPGTEITVIARFAKALSAIDGRIFLNIPMTVGDIYGSSGLPDSDDLTYGGMDLSGDIAIRCDCGVAQLIGADLANGRARVSLNAPIIVEVKNWTARTLIGRHIDGTVASLTMRPSPASDIALDTAILVDHSGSMSEVCGPGGAVTKHSAALFGLSEAGKDLRSSDTLHFFEFDDTVTDLKCADKQHWQAYLRRFSAPRGGTEIGEALQYVIAKSLTHDVVLITDGKSHALDVQALAQSGRRFTVVLIGEDSLEANVGHLASLTGGQIFIASGTDDVTGAVRSALRATRAAKAEIRDGLSALVVIRAGMEISIEASDNAEADNDLDISDVERSRAVAAYVAGLKLPALNVSAAAQLAEAEGLVTHLTSLIAVDEHGEVQVGLAATRKVALPRPRTAVRKTLSPSMSRPAHCLMAEDRSAAQRSGFVRQNFSHGRSKSVVIGNTKPLPPILKREFAQYLPDLAKTLPWKTHAIRLAKGHLDVLDDARAQAIREAATIAEVRDCADRLGLPAELLAIGLLARAAGAHNRFAARVARAILGKAHEHELSMAEAALGLAERQVLHG